MSKQLIYSEMLDDMFEKYEGSFEEYLRYIPKFFKLLQKIYLSPSLSWEQKFKINSCLSYFAIPDDIIPDDVSEIGYIDDLYLCAYILNDILEEDSKLLEDNWDYKGNVSEIVKDVLKMTDETLLKRSERRWGEPVPLTNNILRKVGLLKFKDMHENVGFLFDSVDINSKVERLDYSIMDLMSILRSIFISEGRTPKGRKFRDFKNEFDSKEWDKVIKILENIEVHESKFDRTHEIKMDDIRRKVLLSIDEELLND